MSVDATGAAACEAHGCGAAPAATHFRRSGAEPWVLRGGDVSDQLPPEALAADPDGEPERTPNASNSEDGPESVSEDFDQDGMPDGTVTSS